MFYIFVNSSSYNYTIYFYSTLFPCLLWRLLSAVEMFTQRLKSSPLNVFPLAVQAPSDFSTSFKSSPQIFFPDIISYMFSSARQEFLPGNFLLFEGSIMQTKPSWHNVQVHHNAWIEYMMRSNHLTSYLCEVLEEQGWRCPHQCSHVLLAKSSHECIPFISDKFSYIDIIDWQRTIFCWKQEGFLKFQEDPF